ncbi:MAG: glycine cleavage system H-protein subunit [Ramalina farinacea]|uniref:Glycine cleavage system H protein n=1 Tax=Ramalina farinacea TaxID=258253 RepID=A0AA43QP55_9LECA|nr:glycine cleavage system H-protein subunit [Ramalina farinacea]
MNSKEKRYTKDHEWLELSPDGKTGTIGISTYAAKNLGDVVFVELPDTDMDVKAGDSIGAVESVKSASDIMTPVTGKVVEANDVLQEKPAVINKSPEADGWIAKIEVGDAGRGEHGELMDAKAYEEFTAE